MSYEIEGTLHKVFDTESKSATFQVRDFVIKTEGQYPQFIKFQCSQDRCGMIDGHKEGEQIKVYFDLRGREWNEKYFTNLNAWRVEKPSSQPQVAAPTAQAGFDPTFPTEEPAGNPPAQSNKVEEFDDLPF